MVDALPLLLPAERTLLLVDQQAGLTFGVGSTDRQILLNNKVALARTATAFELPIVVSTSAAKVYSAPRMIERRSMNLREAASAT
jgi:nicotinamidase-related amidase